MPAAHRRADAGCLVGVEHVHVEARRGGTRRRRRARSPAPSRPRMPSRSMSAIVNTCTPTRRSWLRSPRSTLRMPTSTVRASSAIGTGHREVLGPLVAGQTERDRQRHAVDVAAGRAGRRVDVGVRVQPDDAARAAARPGEPAQRRRSRSSGRRPAPAASRRRHTDLGDAVGELLAGAADRRPVAGGGIALVQRLDHARADVAVIVRRRGRAPRTRSPSWA